VITVGKTLIQIHTEVLGCGLVRDSPEVEVDGMIWMGAESKRDIY